MAVAVSTAERWPKIAEQDDNLEPDSEEDARRARFQSAADQGSDQLAAVLDDQIQGLAEEFETRVERLLNAVLDGGQSGTSTPPRQFVSGAAFGAVLFLLSLIASLSVVKRPKQE